MKKLVVVLALLILAPLARANDSAIQGVGGTPAAIGSLAKIAPLKGEHPTVAMVRERVAITVAATSYDVVADFEFHNDGAARQVLMGFPERAGGDIDIPRLAKNSGYTKFATSVDGQPFQARRIPVTKNAEEEFDAYWVKSVPFARHQTRQVRVSYRAPLGESAEPTNFVSYDFTGGNWKGRVAESVLSVRFTVPGQYLLWPVDRELKAQEWRNGDTLSFRWTNWQAQSGFNLHFRSTLPGALTLSKTADVNQKQPPEDGQTMLNVPGPHPWRAQVTQRTDALVRYGHAFISIGALADELKSEYQSREAGTGKKQRYGILSWNPQQRSATLTLAGGESFTFRDGSKAMLFGKASLPLSIAPFIGGSGPSETLYVPLADAAKAIGGQVKVNTTTRRAWLNLSKVK